MVTYHEYSVSVYNGWLCGRYVLWTQWMSTYTGHVQWIQCINIYNGQIHTLDIMDSYVQWIPTVNTVYLTTASVVDTYNGYNGPG